jgi:hypothetical protein
MNTIATKAATLAAALLLGVLLAFNMEPSNTQHVWIFSYLKATILFFVIAAIVYLAISLRFERLQRFNTLFVYGVVVNLIIVEAAFQLFPSLVPADLVGLLPMESRTEIAADRGLFTARTFAHDGMLYSFRGQERPLEKFPWVEIDEYGYRNPAVPEKNADMVLFGDSVTFARHARKDIAQLLRDRGIAAYSLAMGGNGPFHYRDTYRKYVVERNLDHKYAVVFLSLANDFGEAAKYAKVVRQGGTYRDYLGEMSTIGVDWPDRQPLWTVAILARLPAYMRKRLTSVRGALSRFLGERFEVILPYATYPATPQLLELRNITEDGELWRAFSAAIDDLSDSVDGAGARLVLVLMPSPALLYRNYVIGFEPFKRTLDTRYRTIRRLIEERYASRGVMVVDVVEPMAREMGKRNLAANPLDYHFNSEGWVVLSDVLVELLGL